MNDLRNVITIATGKKIYLELAANLARSFHYWNKDSGINFYLVTDSPDAIDNDILSFTNIITIKPGELGEGFSSKLYLDKLAPEGRTLFIDSDCLVFGSLDFLFERFKGHSVSVVGGYISDGEWFGNVGEIQRKFDLQRYPKFNGGIYYVERSAGATKVYETARSLQPQYDEIGFVRLRGQPNDEVLMALAMQLHNQQPIADDGTIMSDPQSCPGPLRINVISGKRYMINPPAPHHRHQPWYPFEEVSPVIVHFLEDNTHSYQYRKEIYRLKYALSKNLNWHKELYAAFSIEYPERLKIKLKDVFRPFFHLLFGTRKVKQSERV